MEAFLLAFLVFDLFLVCTVTSYPRPMGQRPLGNATAMGLRGVKFPNPSKVSSPAGEWAKEGRNSTGRVNVANKDGIFFPEDIVDQPIVPSSGSGRIKTSFVPSPTCADGNTFCESVDDYPDGHINSILQNNAVQFKTLFGEDTIDPPLSHRIDAVDENPMCASQEKLVFPKSAKNKEDVWMFIVNQDQYQQGVRIEICVKASQGGTGEQCSFTESFPLGYQTSCKQKYIYRKLLAVDRKSGETVADTFQLPSCCSCTVKQNLINRVGVPVNRSPKSTQPPPKQENKT